ncbi:MAG: PAS domain-containing protein, partial [Deltaproteobacteria bacterium]|nr:PAS domain-containing protein [Deltaproteobacteria bacterium]
MKDMPWGVGRRSAPEEIRTAANLVGCHRFFRELADSLSNPLVVLDENRQIVFANARFLETMGAEDLLACLGLRPGEAL